ncbi:uncharacterized protein LOC129580110 [Sitodiplosis mosellana]|uniref:uncharacterized protein LOC129580110 n=1 Tax=Sitodiplosis mosellana TaxID=263140 RepID=UPI0024441830|nr:uncharacterized protein LOC129580110 [Sitodiplosis mosellana]
MSLFIWNDQDWKLVDVRMKFDKDVYAVVRKLFVQWVKKSNTANTKDLIREEFAKYGAIKAVEMLTNPADYQDEAAAELSEAYVTFVQSKCAYQAFMAHRKYGKFPKEAITVLPADSWRQGDVLSNASLGFRKARTSLEEENLALNEAMSQLFIKNEQQFQLKKKLLVDMGADFSLKKWLLIARNLKDDLEYLILKFSSKSDEANSNQNRLTIDEYEKRVVQVMASNCVGESFSAMSIVSKNSISMEMLRCMAPLLKPLVSLIVENRLNAHLVYALPEFCPRMRMLRLLGTWDGQYQDQPVVNWPTLHILIFMNRTLDVKSYTEDGKKFRRFIESNPQLEMLLFDTIIDIELLKGIVDNLANIKVLSFRRLNYYRFSLILEHLTKAELLESISITFNIAEKVDLEKISIMVERLGQMKDMKLVTLMQNYMPNTAQKENFTMLSSFPITEHRNCECHNKQRLLAFDGVIPDQVVPDDVPVLVIVINTNNPSKSQDKSLESDIWNVLDDTKKSFPNIIRFEELKDGNHSVYVYIASA